MDKVGNVGIFALPKFENKLHTVISHICFISMYHDQFQFVVKLFRFVIKSILFSLEAIQKCQRCQLCVLRENSNDKVLIRVLA